MEALRKVAELWVRIANELSVGVGALDEDELSQILQLMLEALNIIAASSKQRPASLRLWGTLSSVAQASSSLAHAMGESLYSKYSTATTGRSGFAESKSISTTPSPTLPKHTELAPAPPDEPVRALEPPHQGP